MSSITLRSLHLLSVLLLLVPGRARAEANCKSDSPARPVPQYSPAEAPGVSLWPLDHRSGHIRLRPANVLPGTTRNELEPLPEERDSTQYLTQTAPGVASGHELFQDVIVPGARDEAAGQSPWMIAVYNAGIQVWDISAPETPTIAQRRDGWTAPYGPGEWAHFAAFGEDDYFVHSVDAVQAGHIIYIAVAGSSGVGFSAWTFDTTTQTLTQIYQDLAGDAYEVSMVVAPSGPVTAFATDPLGVRVYDVSAAADNGLCIDNDDDACGVYRGLVGDIPRTRFVSAAVLDGVVYVVASDGNAVTSPLGLELWEVGNPGQPATTSVRRFSAGGEAHIHAPRLFTYHGAHYMALVDKSEGISAPGEMRIHPLGDCLLGCPELPPALATESLKLSLANYHFLDVSFSEGSPFLHNGMATTGLHGAGFERLWELERLPEVFAPNTLPELTDGGGTYIDPCSGEEVDYFGDYYINNDYGLRHFNPRHAVFTGPYLYRAAKGVLDVHVRAVPVCGDGVAQGQEACDDGNDDDTDACTSACKLAACGDGLVQIGEACDDGNTIPDDECTNTCAFPACGDGIVQEGEACDDPDDLSCVDCMVPGVDTTVDGSSSGDVDDDDGMSESGDGGQTDGAGCSCSSTDPGGGALAFVGLLTLIGLRRERRWTAARSSGTAANGSSQSERA